MQIGILSCPFAEEKCFQEKRRPGTVRYASWRMRSLARSRPLYLSPQSAQQQTRIIFERDVSISAFRRFILLMRITFIFVPAFLCTDRLTKCVFPNFLAFIQAEL